MSEDKKVANAIPAWQQAATPSDDKKESAESTSTSEAVPDEILEAARDFLKDDAIRDAPREEKLEFLKSKGLSSDAIEKLLAGNERFDTELKTVHDTSEKEPILKPVEADNPASLPSAVLEKPPTKADMAPIITYPEFLLKPQKPPPLITVSRLINAAYAIAGISTLTYSASKYILEPMLENLTEARHELADSAFQDLERLNSKLEGTVSHVPYFASSNVKRLAEQESDVESITSDPTELFHRDIATQTSPGLSRSSSSDSLSKHALNPTISQAERLSGLEYSLRSLVQSMDHTADNERHLQNTVKDMQTKLDTLESSYSLLKNDYWSSTYSSAGGDAKKAANRENEAQKFKQEIRALKGAFLSSRNFPTAPRTGTAGAAQGSR